MKTDFADFTNLYELSKTLRFELKPVGETQRLLEENNVFQKDEIIQKKYKRIKVYFDRLHREFVAEALRDVSLSKIQEYLETLKNIKKITKETDKKQKDQWEKCFVNEEKRLRKEVVGLFNIQAKKWSEEYLGLKNSDLKILDEEAVFEKILLERYGKNEDGSLKENTLEKVEIIDKKTGEIKTIEESIFKGWKGFTGYFTKFFETRKNFYKDDGTSTALATRIIDQNLRRFAENIEILEKIKKEIDFTEVEENFKESMSEVFILDFYNKCMLQGGIDFYNKILGGETLESGEKLKGINELINKYRQDNKGKKPPFLKPLDKQILSEKDKFIKEIENDEDLLKRLKIFSKNAEEKTEVIKKIFENLEKDSWDKKELEEIYISKEAFGRTLSHSWTGETELFEKVVFEAFKTEKDNRAKYIKAEDKYTFPNSISLQYIKNGLNTIDSSTKFWKERYYKDEKDKTNEGFLELGKIDIWDEFLQIFIYEFSSLFEKVINKGSVDEKIIGYENSKKDFIGFLENFDVNKTITKEQKIVIKDFSDDTKKIYQMANYFTVEKKRKWNPEHLELGDFYTNPDFGYEIFHTDAYEQIVKTYDLLRNYLTKKPWEEVQKWKLNFENSTLADGWDKNKEMSNFAVILQKDKKYFLGLMKKGCNYLFADKNKDKFKGDGYKKMVYKFTKDVVTGIPKSSTQLQSVVDHFKNSDEDYILEKTSSVGDFIKPLIITKEIFNFNNKIFLKTDLLKSLYRWELNNKNEEKDYVKSFQIDFLRLGGDKNTYEHSVKNWLKFCFNFLNSYPSTVIYDYSSLKSPEDYSNINDCYNDMNQCGYKITFQDVSENYIEEKNKNGELYLFQIKNKDWNEGSTGRKNLHTMYFENLFSEANIAKNFIFKLNGQAEIFYRPKAIDEVKVKRNFPREIIEKKRYTKDKVFFHVPLTLNRGTGKSFSFNRQINEFLAHNSDINIIGVDRGEKHLAYYSVINQQSEILDNGTLNVVNGVDYHQKLEERAKNREQERKDWQAVEGIKDLKKGYISQVVRKLADLAIEHNAIIVFEDLNMRFKQIRGGIEKSVYQQLEKALIEKLNFLVNKGEKDAEKAGHLLKAYQLAAPFETFKDMGKQTGIIFYTTASYTSKIDPVTGWRPNLYLKYSSAEKAKKEISKFSKIEFKDDRFEFTYDIKNFKDLKDAPKNTIWTVCSCVERFRWNRKLNNNKHYGDLTNEFKQLFEDVGIDWNKDILGQIDVLNEKEQVRFFKDFIFFFNLICQIRNTDNSEKAKKEGKDDFILSPVVPFFDSRVDNGDKLPKNGDDNGAFNIARKGVITLGKINDWVDEHGDCKKLGWKELFIGNTEWDNFTQQ